MQLDEVLQASSMQKRVAPAGRCPCDRRTHRKIVPQVRPGSFPRQHLQHDHAKGKNVGLSCGGVPLMVHHAVQSFRGEPAGVANARHRRLRVRRCHGAFREAGEVEIPDLGHPGRAAGMGEGMRLKR